MPKGNNTAWFFQSLSRSIAVIIHGNQKDPCLSKLYKVVLLFDKATGILEMIAKDKKQPKGKKMAHDPATHSCD
jgi:hypothetical protein